MSFKKKFHRIISMFCVAVLLLPMVLGLSVSAAEKRYLGYPVNLLIGEKLPVNSFVDEKGKAAKIEIAEGQYTLITYWASWCPDCQEELAYLHQLKEVLKDYPNVKWYLVDRVDGQDESIQSGSEYNLPKCNRYSGNSNNHPAQSAGGTGAGSIRNYQIAGQSPRYAGLCHQGQRKGYRRLCEQKFAGIGR